MMYTENVPWDEDDPAGRMADFFSPAQVDQSIRQAIQFCWMALPRDRRNADELERQFRRLVDRALKDFQEDSEAFRPSKGPGSSAAGKPSRASGTTARRSRKKRDA